MKLNLIVLIWLTFSLDTLANNEITVIFPNNYTILNTNSEYAITWNTQNSITNSEVLEILLSVDNGRNYLIKLKEVINDGNETIIIPRNISESDSSKIRIRLKSNNSIFDDSDFCFKIQSQFWSLLIDNIEDVNVPNGDTLADLKLFAYHMRPFKKWQYSLKNSYSNNSVFFGNFLNPNFCGAENQNSRVNENKLKFKVSKDAIYRLTHTTINNASTSNAFNIFQFSNLQSCQNLVGTNYFINGSSRSFFINVISNLKQDQFYELKVLNYPLEFIDSGFIEIFNHSLSNTNFYDVQPIQSDLKKTFLALDELNYIAAISDSANFRSLNSGIYKIFSILYPIQININQILNQNVSNLNFHELGLDLSQNFVNLKITSPCISNLILNNNFKGVFSTRSNVSIVSTEVYLNSSRINYKAGNVIELLPGFLVDKTSYFKAEIGGCN